MDNRFTIIDKKGNISLANDANAYGINLKEATVIAIDKTLDKLTQDLQQINSQIDRSGIVHPEIGYLFASIKEIKSSISDMNRVIQSILNQI